MKRFFKHLLAVLILVLGGASILNAQTRVSGKVTDESGLPLPGVAVMVSGTGTGTMTDDNGFYSMSGLKKGVTLVFSSLGMAEQSFVWDGKQAQLNVVMKEDVNFIEETIVVGYGTQKKSSMTSAVSAMKGDELLKAPSTNVSQLLAGKLPGISSVQESGEPGLDQASLRIRGSIYGASYIVDGFPVENLNDIDPADIESISVLKDGASAAVYGLKSAGGVIIVTTQRGASGKPKISYSASVGASMNANFPEFMDGPKFAYYYNVAQMMDQLASGAIASESEYVPYFKKSQVELMLNDDPSDGWDNVNYIKKVFGTGLTQKHNVTVQGGTEKTKYFASFGYLGQKGNIDNFNYDRFNVRANIDTELARNFKFTLGLSGVLSNRRTPAFNSGGTDSNSYLGETGWLSIANQTIQMHPYLPEKYDGLYSASIKKNTSLPQSPLAAIYESGYKKTRGMSVSANTSLSYELPWVKGLVLKVSGVFDYGTSYNKNLNTPYELMAYSGGAWTRTSDPRGNGSGVNLGEGSSYWQQLVGQASISYANSFGKNNLDLLALAEMRDYKSNNLSAYVKEIPFASLPELSYGKPEQTPVMGSSGASRSAGYVFRARYNYDEKYLAEFTGRVDGSYKFAGMLHTRWGFFPSGSIGWRISKEDFMKNVNCIDDLKIRASAGLLGNDNVSEYMFLASYGLYDSKIVYPLSGGSISSNPAYGPSGVPNTDLSWEKTLSYNVGFDLSMWDEKLGMEVDGFYNYTYDILTYQSSGFPSSMGGYYPTWVNQNALDSKGIDIQISHRNKFMAGSHPFYYGISASLT